MRGRRRTKLPNQYKWVNFRTVMILRLIIQSLLWPHLQKKKKSWGLEMISPLMSYYMLQISSSISHSRQHRPSDTTQRVTTMREG